MYVWESQKELNVLIDSLQPSKREKFYFKVKQDGRFSLSSAETGFLFPFRIRYSRPRFLKGIIKEKGTGSEIRASLKLEWIDKIFSSIMVIGGVAFGIYALFFLPHPRGLIGFHWDAVWVAVFGFLVALYNILITIFSKGKTGALLEYMTVAAGNSFSKMR